MVDFIIRLDDLMWGVPMIVFLFGTHIYLTIRTRFVQKHVFRGIRYSLQSGDGNGDLGIFSSLMTALSSTIGTGNIIGVGTAITLGGPGAVLWTWLAGILGIATKYGESFIAVKYRRKEEDGSYLGGAMTALEHLDLKFLAKLFAVFAALAAFGIGCATQSNAIATALADNFSISKPLIGIVLCVLTFIVIFGGVKSIARVCTGLIPFMSIIYTLGCIYILIYNHAYLGQTVQIIVSSAFTAKAMQGGFVGSTLMIAARYGIARGLFSNESGMGSAPMATAVGNAKNAVKPALVGSTGVFWDTVVVCLMTGLAVCSSVVANDAVSSIGLNGSELVTACFNTIPVVGKPLLIFGIVTFAYSTILGWSFFGETCTKYLFGKGSVKIYQALWIVVIYLGVAADLDAVWAVADILNGAMCIPNIIAVLLLSKQIAEETKYYLDEGHIEETDPSIR